MFPAFINLMKPIDDRSITRGRLADLLAPNFSEEGANSRCECMGVLLRIWHMLHVRFF